MADVKESKNPCSGSILNAWGCHAQSMRHAQLVISGCGEYILAII